MSGVLALVVGTSTVMSVLLTWSVRRTWTAVDSLSTMASRVSASAELLAVEAQGLAAQGQATTAHAALLSGSVATLRTELAMDDEFDAPWEMKPARPVRDRYALHADALWTYRRGQEVIPVSLTKVRAMNVALQGALMHTDLESDEPLFLLLETMRHDLDVAVIEGLSILDATGLVREFPPVQSILEGL